MKVLRANSNHLFFCILTQTRAELRCTRVRHFPGPAFPVFDLFWSAIFRSCKFSALRVASSTKLSYDQFSVNNCKFSLPWQQGVGRWKFDLRS